MPIPPENLSLIVQFAIQDDDTLDNHGAGLSLVSGFSLASQQFRQIALREIFRTYYLTAPPDIQRLERVPDMYNWIRDMHCPVPLAMHITEEQFARFSFLRSVHLWGPSSCLSTVLRRLPAQVQELTLPFDHNHHHHEILSATTRFSKLLRLRVARSRFEFPPAVDVSMCGDVPPHHYAYSSIAAEMLKPLCRLRVLEIDHHLTDTDCVEFHKTQCPWSSDSNAFCATCWEKFGLQTANAEITCTLIMAASMQSLEIVAWKSWFTPDAEGQSRVFINREVGQDGREEVRAWREREAIEATWKRLSTNTGLSKKCCLRQTQH